MTDVIGTTRGDRLAFPGFYRATLGRSWEAFGDHDLTVGMERWHAGTVDLDYIVLLNPPQQVPGDDVVVVDLATQASARTYTVAQLVDTLNNLSYLIDLTKLERIEESDATRNGPASRDEARQQEQQQHDQNQFDPIGDLKSVGKWLLIGVVVLVVVVVLLEGKSLAGALRAVTGKG